MDQEPGSLFQRKTPRLSSRLPRATPSNALATPQDAISKGSNIPRPSTTTSLRLRAVEPLSENGNTSLKSRFRFDQHGLHARDRSPVKDALHVVQSALLETTPPSVRESGIPYADYDEGALSQNSDHGGRPDAAKSQSRRPRPSLTERTLETMSQISTSPSPSRRRSSVVGASGSMGPPVRPASSMRQSRPGTPSTERPTSPHKQAFYPPGRYESPSKDTSSIPAFQKTNSIYTPPRALVKEKGSRIARPSSARRSVLTAMDDNHVEQKQPNRIPHGHKMKSMYNLRAAAAKSSTDKPPLQSLFRDPPKTPLNENKLKFPSLDRNAGLLKPRSPGEDVLALKPTRIVKLPPKQAAKNTEQTVQTLIEDSGKPDIKLSTSLRETISKAKAAKKQALIRTTTLNDASHFDLSTHVEIPSSSPAQISDVSVARRVQTAVTTGTLNVAALGLKKIPDQIMKMYDFEENSKVNWSEAVDMTKLIIADNELTELGDDVFPDWSIEELTDDDEKTNIFAGLTTLDLRGNRLVKLPIGLRRLTRLQTLNLSNNRLTNTAFDVISQIPNLRELNLANNALEGMLPASIAQLTQLIVLDLQDNRLSQITVKISDLTCLQRLNLSNNVLSMLSTTEMERLPLTELDISHNRITGTLFDSKSLSKLRRLNASGNQFNRLCSSGLDMSNLQTLAVDNNQINVMPDMSALSALMTLTMSENRLEELPEGFVQLQALRVANLSGNNIKTIDARISTMENLTTLTLSGNPLRDRKYLSMATDEIKADLAKRLLGSGALEDSSISATSTGISTQSVATAQQESQYLYRPTSGVLDISSLSMTTLELSQIDLTSSVHTIRLSNNDLTTFPTDLLSHPNIRYSLRSFDMSHNPSLHPTNYLDAPIVLPVLRSLYIASTGLTCLDDLTTHLSAPSLQELNISSHHLKGHVPRLKAQFPSLTTLLATDNCFTSIDVEAVRGLEVLDLRNNEIEALPAKIGELGNQDGQREEGKLRIFEVQGNRFRSPRVGVVEKGSEAVLRDLRRMVPEGDVGDEWR